MKTIFSKKILACVLAVCMLFTMCAGALSVSAETLEGSAKIGAAVYNADGTVVPVTFTAADIGGADLRINVPAGLTITKVELVAGEVEVTYLQDADSEPVSVTVDDAETEDVNEAVSEIAVYTREGVAQFIILDDTAEFVGQDEVVINLTFAGELTEEVAIAFADGTMGGNVDEGLYELTLTNGKITIPHVHTPGEAVVENEVAATCDADGSYDEVVYCTECEEEVSRETKTIEALGHSWDDGVVTTEPDCDDAGVKTFTCSACKTTKTEAVDALGHTEVPVPAVDPTCVDTGLTAGTKCSVCDAVIDAQEEVPASGEHTYEDGKCSVCGAADPNAGPQKVDTLTFRGASVGFGTSSLKMTFRISKSVIDGYHDAALVITPDKYDLDTDNLIENPTEIVIPRSKLKVSGNFYIYEYTDIQLYEVGLTIKYELRAYDNDGDEEYDYYNDFSTSPRQYLKEQSINDPSNALLRTIVSDVFMVADESAAYFGNEGSQLASQSSMYDAEFDNSGITPDSVLETYTLNTVDSHTPTNAEWGTDAGTHKVAKSVAVEKVPTFSYRIRGGNSIDLDKISFRVTYAQQVGKGNTEPYDETFTSADTANVYKSGTFLMFKFVDVGLLDGNSTISIVATYDGAEVFNATYSIETYLNATMNDDTNAAAPLAKALVKLGISARAYFS